MATMLQRRDGISRWAKAALAVCLLAGLLAALALPALAQENALTLRVRKQFGYNLGSQIQGQFLISATGPADLAAVTFTIDGATLGEVTAAPFELSFQTGAYALGWHTLGATGLTADGQTLEGKELRFEFVPASSAAQGALSILAPILVVVFGGMLVMVVIPLLRKGKGGAAATPVNGILGGTVCPKCGRPFGLHIWALNVSFAGKYDRCPHCGKWSFVRRASPAVLEAAAAEKAASAEAAAAAAPATDPEQQRKKHLDDSRYV
ncbi:MAG: hypothetical protein RBT75_03910 [Anaerolineae bacterium]|jgi:hypothetical protein|nr:hypothetical protein [Anaerolineae bacterium]